MTSTEIQTIAALIQAAAAVVFLVIAAQVVRPKRRRDLLVRAKPNSLTLGLRRWACHGLTPFPCGMVVMSVPSRVKSNGAGSQVFPSAKPTRPASRNRAPSLVLLYRPHGDFTKPWQGFPYYRLCDENRNCRRSQHHKI
jgi:hypothetical protein